MGHPLQHTQKSVEECCLLWSPWWSDATALASYVTDDGGGLLEKFCAITAKYLLLILLLLLNQPSCRVTRGEVIKRRTREIMCNSKHVLWDVRYFFCLTNSVKALN